MSHSFSAHHSLLSSVVRLPQGFPIFLIRHVVIFHLNPLWPELSGCSLSGPDCPHQIKMPLFGAGQCAPQQLCHMSPSFPKLVYFEKEVWQLLGALNLEDHSWEASNVNCLQLHLITTKKKKQDCPVFSVISNTTGAQWHWGSSCSWLFCFPKFAYSRFLQDYGCVQSSLSEIPWKI